MSEVEAARPPLHPLPSVPYPSDLGEHALDAVVQVVIRREYQSDEVVFLMDDLCDSLYAAETG
jgi:hypothetical protein